MAKTTANKMSPKTEHPRSQAPKYNRSKSKLLLESDPLTGSTIAASPTRLMKPTPPKPEHYTKPSTKSTHSNHEFHIIADMSVHHIPRQRLIPFRPRGHFIASLVKFIPRGPLILHDTRGLPMIRFNPFDRFSLTSATEYTISLLAKLCIYAGARATLLALPVELRLKIYELAFEGHWKGHKKNKIRFAVLTIFYGAYVPDKVRSEDQPKANPELDALEPPILRVCKLFRQEGIGEYQRFLQAIRDAQQEQEAAISRDREEPYDCWERLSEMKRLFEIRPPRLPMDEGEYSAGNAENELKRLRSLDRATCSEEGARKAKRSQ